MGGSLPNTLSPVHTHTLTARYRILARVTAGPGLRVQGSQYKVQGLGEASLPNTLSQGVCTHPLSCFAYSRIDHSEEVDANTEREPAILAGE